MSAVQACLMSCVAACRMKVWFLDVLLLNQISKRSPLSPVDSVRPTSAVCETKRGSVCPTGLQWKPCGGHSYLEGVFVDEDVKPSLHLPGFTEEH